MKLDKTIAPFLPPATTSPDGATEVADRDVNVVSEGHVAVESGGVVVE